MKKEILNNMAGYIDHSIVKADAAGKEIIAFCEEAKQYGFASVAVNSSYVELAKSNLAGSGVRICATAGYPLGAGTTDTKKYEAEQCSLMGADELDIVMNIGYFLDENYDYVVSDLRTVVEAFKSYGNDKLVKVIIEAPLIGNNRIRKAVECAIDAGADFVKTSSGYGGGGAKLEDVIAMTEAAAGRIKVKAAGGIRSLNDAYELIMAGAERLGGTGGVKIVEEAMEELRKEL